MKLKEGFILHTVGGDPMLISDRFRGFARMSDEGQLMVNMLLHGTTEEAILDALCEKYDAPRETIAAHVQTALADLRKAGMLDE